MFNAQLSILTPRDGDSIAVYHFDDGSGDVAKVPATASMEVCEECVRGTDYHLNLCNDVVSTTRESERSVLELSHSEERISDGVAADCQASAHLLV